MNVNSLYFTGNTNNATNNSIATVQTPETPIASSAPNSVLASLVEDSQKVAGIDTTSGLSNADLVSVAAATVTVSTASTQQAWHQHVTQDLRRHLVHKL